MGHLSTHVLDTARGCPAAGMKATLIRMEDTGPVPMRSVVLNADGRADAPLLQGDALRVGRYRLAFEVGHYFRATGHALPDPAFLEVVNLDFGIADAQGHYHVPLLVSPWSYSTYRGS